MLFQLNTLRQSSRRSWRIGQTEPCRTIYLYWAESAQQTGIALMGSKLVAAEAIEGKFEGGGLADESADEDIALAVAKSLADNIRKKPDRLYKPVEATQSNEERLTIMRKKIAIMRQRLAS